MKTRLDQIEAQLQSLIEGSLSIFARSGPQQRLAHHLVAAIQENIVTGADGRAIAPNVYTIYLHPRSLTYWEQHVDLLEEIAKSLQAAVRENEIYFLREPVLRLASDRQLPEDEVLVVASDVKPKVTGHTAVFPLNRESNNASVIPRNAFLIVDGNRVFPLNRTVVNIGRRPDNHLVLSDPRVSRAHAQLRAVRGQYILFDLNSSGGTSVNGRRVRQYTLKQGDVISLSGVPLIYGEDNLPEDDTDRTGATRTVGTRPSSAEIEE
jgi:hypothetical protein